METFDHSKGRITAQKSQRRRAQCQHVLSYLAVGLLGAGIGYALWGFPQAVLVGAAMMYVMHLVGTPNTD